MAGSEIAQFRQQQAAEEESAQLALFGPAAVARHDAILARMRQGEETLVRLFQAGRDQEAFNLWDRGILEGRKP